VAEDPDCLWHVLGLQAVKDHIDKHLAVIIGLVKEGLNPKGGKAFSTNALTCVSMLARAVGSKLTPHIMNDLVGT